LLAASFLATRVNCASEQDWEKLQRLLKWFNLTRNDKLRLEMNRSDVQQVIVSVDASHAVHKNNMRGHTGYAISLGKGTILAGSMKQKINTRSSTESELVAVSDALCNVMFVDNLLRGQHLIVSPVVLLQDKQSTVYMMRNGKGSSSLTRHIDIRYFWITDLLRAERVVLQISTSKQMSSDTLTKPLQGEAFERHDEVLINKIN
jgi:hypothetical protein